MYFGNDSFVNSQTKHKLMVEPSRILLTLNLYCDKKVIIYRSKNKAYWLI